MDTLYFITQEKTVLTLLNQWISRPGSIFLGLSREIEAGFTLEHQCHSKIVDRLLYADEQFP